ncbi:hypothetical protein HNQ64_002136 [Prosthecobacter dejongeii]|uniref:Uncharacterized protein n=1 Tax=Prosthecobacter dejongeii TaxID=48465 RepID=A0A7W7YKX6_9BACT|nr:hypothetical protein [Prosthecobacter dejongeii]
MGEGGVFKLDEFCKLASSLRKNAQISGGQTSTERMKDAFLRENAWARPEKLIFLAFRLPPTPNA